MTRIRQNVCLFCRCPIGEFGLLGWLHITWHAAAGHCVGAYPARQQYP